MLPNVLVLRLTIQIEGTVVMPKRRLKMWILYGFKVEEKLSIRVCLVQSTQIILQDALLDSGLGNPMVYYQVHRMPIRKLPENPAALTPA